VPATRPRAATAAILERYQPVIGVEVHCQLKTVSKMFCGCSTAYDGAPPNSHVCPVCLGLPGSLPTINGRAVELVLSTGLAIEATSPPVSRWDRKNYFYPDLPKGYQISQFDLPLASNGRLDVETATGPVSVRIRRAHLEEDTARLVHAERPDGHRVSLLDFNRSGAPLMEIVTEPDLHSAEAARRYAEELQLLLRSIGASDADMERGQLRVEANVSLRPRGSEALGTRVEVKNMNSFRSVERAIEFEIARQAEALDGGETLTQDTRGWSEDRGRTYVMRSKEESHDYHYFPEPDLPPLRVDPAWLEDIAGHLPELPAAKRKRRSAEGMPPSMVEPLVTNQILERAFDETQRANPDLPPIEIGRWVTQEYAFASNSRSTINELGFVDAATPRGVGAVIREQLSGSISMANAKEVFRIHVETGDDPAEIIRARGFHQISDADAIGAAADAVIAGNPTAVADYRAGKTQVLGFLVGQVMKATKGQANPGAASAALRSRLDDSAGS
jgi:aspartyl-tRNA(Asn)/glutamyl-tRNA(Gln) amidotransferase subunit B